MQQLSFLLLLLYWRPSRDDKPVQVFSHSLKCTAAPGNYWLYQANDLLLRPRSQYHLLKTKSGNFFAHHAEALPSSKALPSSTTCNGNKDNTLQTHNPVMSKVKTRIIHIVTGKFSCALLAQLFLHGPWSILVWKTYGLLGLLLCFCKQKERQKLQTHAHTRTHMQLLSPQLLYSEWVNRV